MGLRKYEGKPKRTLLGRIASNGARKAAREPERIAIRSVIQKSDPICKCKHRLNDHRIFPMACASCDCRMFR